MASLPISNSILENVLAHYPLSQARILGILAPSKRNDNFVVEDINGNRYALRRYRRNNQEDRVRFQLRFQQHLERSGFPTPKVLRTVSGDVMVTENHFPWALFSFVEGSEYDFGSLEQATEAARRLAQFHTLTETFEDKEVILGISRMPDWWTDSEQEIHMLEEFFTGMEVEKDLKCIREYVDELICEYPLQKVAALRSSWVHGDYHGRNMVFVEDEMRGLFDFDVVHRGNKVKDIYKAIFMFGRHHRESSIIRPDVAWAFLAEYRQNTKLEQKELEALPVIAVLDCVPFVSYFTMLQRDGEDTFLTCETL